MFSPSIPEYLDPCNWQQQTSSHQDQSGGLNLQLLPPPVAAAGGGGMDWVRPSLHAERARLASIPMPQAPLKCPRCDSTNTKFCYFNNYSLSLPRHFCKNCRRYWTRGGTLRRIPVGGHCRKNRRRRAAANLLSHLPPEFQQLLLAAPLSQITEYSGVANDPGFNFNSVAAAEMNIPAGTNLPVELATLLPNGELEQWRLQPPQPNFPFLGGFDQPPQPRPGVLLFQSGVEFPGYEGEQSSPSRPKHSLEMLTAPNSSVKVEDNNHEEPNLAMQLMGVPGSDQWDIISWTDLSNFISSSTMH